jgi:hypothetical protein
MALPMPGIRNISPTRIAYHVAKAVDAVAAAAIWQQRAVVGDRTKLGCLVATAGFH